MTSVADISKWMNTIAPLSLSEAWDNTGLLLGDLACPVERLQTCLTLTPVSVAEAIDRRANMVIVHHPMPFKPLSKLTTQTVTGNLLWALARAGISVYAPHTAWDSAQFGINALLAAKLQLIDVQPVLPHAETPELGAGRIGTLASATSIAALAEAMRQSISACRIRAVVADREVRKVAIACGSGGGLLPKAIELGCDLFLTGEATFHTCLEAEAAKVHLLMLGHFASERFAMEHLAQLLSDQFAEVESWACESESDPVQNI